MNAPARHTEGIRPSAHFTARDTWLNDPNGLLFHDGVYHLFFQTNPNGSTWGDISWGHATSADLVSWEEHDVAIPFTEGELVFSGSAVVDEWNTAGFAGPGQTALVAIYTAASPPGVAPATQAQALAFSLDAGETWSRFAGNPVLDIGSAEFRDPKVFRHGGRDGHWVMVAVEAMKRQVLVFTSDDLLTWTETSRFGPAHAVDGVWECPDLFPLTCADTGEIRWVMIVSLNPGGIAGGSGTQYFVGSFDGAMFTPDRIVEDGDLGDYDWLDFGPDYYAAVSFNDAPDGRRLVMAWASNWLYANDTPTHPWRSSMSLVREISLSRRADDTHGLRQKPIVPRDAQVHRFSASRTGRTAAAIANASGERLALLVEDGVLTCDRSESGDISFHEDFVPFVQVVLPQTHDRDGDDVEITVVVDGTVIEVFAVDGRLAITMQVFPSSAFDRLVLHEQT